MKDKIVHVFIYGLIGSFIDEKGNTITGVELDDVIAQVSKNKEAEEVHVHINSEGGEVQAGFDIHNYLKGLSQKVITMVAGDCGSIATIVALAGEERTITSDSKFTIHNPWGLATGDTDEVANYAKSLKTIEDQIINFYHQATGIDKNSIDALMKKETEMTPEKAVTMKFMTSLITPKEVLAYIPKNQKVKVAPTTTSKLDEVIDKFKALLNGDTKIFNQRDITWTLADNTQVIVETEDGTPTVGDKVTKDGEPMPDGTHTLSTGATVTTMNGEITAMSDATSGSGHDDDDKNKDKDNAAIEALKVENQALKTSVDKIQNSQNASNVAMDAIMGQLKLMGETMASGYKVDPNDQTFNKTNGTQSQSTNMVDTDKVYPADEKKP